MLHDLTVQPASLSAYFTQLHQLLSHPDQQAAAARLLTTLQAEVAQQLRNAQTQLETLQRQLEEKSQGQPLDYTYDLMMQAEHAARIGGWELLLDTLQFYATEALYHIFEVPPEFQSTYEPVWNFQSAEAKEQLEAVIQTCLTTGEQGEAEVQVTTYTGRSIWVRLIANVGYRAEQKRLYGSIQDISTFKATELALHESELRFRQLAEHANSVFWLTEADPERLLYVSPGYEALWGRPRAALSTSPYDWLEAVHRDDRDRVFTAITSTQTSGGYNQEFRLVQPDGTIRWVRDRSFPIFDKTGRLYRIAGLTEDITEQRQSAEALRESEERFRQLAESINQAFWLADHTQVLYVSPAYEAIWGQLADSFYADPWQWLRFVHPEDRQRVRATVELGQGEFDQEYRIIRPDGSLRWIHDRAFPIRDEEGQVVRLAGLAADITEQKRQRDAMQLLLECAHVTGTAFFDTLVSTLAEVLDMPQVLLCEVDWQHRELQTIAVWDQGKRQRNFQIALQNGGVIEAILQGPRSYAQDITTLFPNDSWLQQTGASSCVGAPLRTVEGNVIGCLIALSPLPSPDSQIPEAILEIFAGRAVNELERQQAETAIKNLNLALEARVNERTMALAEANAALQLREQQLRQIIDLVPHLLFVQDLEGRFILANQATADHYQTTTETIVGKTVAELNSQAPPINLTIQDDLALMRTGRHRIVHLQKLVDAQNNLQILQTTIVPFVLSGIETPGIIGISIDITEQKRIEEELRRSEARQRALLDAMPDLFLRISRDGYFLDFSAPPGIPTLIPAGNIIGSHINTLPVPAEAIEQSLIAYDKAILTGEVQTVEYSAMTPDGLKFYESRVVRSGPDEVVSIVRDITQRVKVEAALRSSEEKFAKLFYTSPLPMMITRLADGKYIDINDQCLDYLGLQREPDTGKIVELIPIWPSEAVQERIIEQLRQQGSLLNTELTFRVRTNELREAQVSVAMIVLDGEEYALWAIADITERKAAQAAIQQVNEELEKRVLLRTRELEIANHELESFSYSVSHDLRAPLRAINGFSQALLEDYGDKLDGEGLHYLERVRAASQRMAILIDDMLTLARVTRQELRQTTINLSEIATTILAELQTTQPERTVYFTVEPNLKAVGDPNLLTIVLDNLLHNAWKYSSKHEVAHIHFGSLIQDDKTIYFVKDDGAGFDMQYASKLFGAFQRLHNQQEFEGTGIGLATVHRIIQRHGGQVWAEGAVEQGATFYFTLPTSP